MTHQVCEWQCHHLTEMAGPGEDQDLWVGETKKAGILNIQVFAIFP